MKVDSLSGAALDWAVAKCEVEFGCTEHYYRYYRYSTNWQTGGPIIEREGINVERGNDLFFPKGNEKGDYYEPLWLASYKTRRKFHGTTPLEAAMRCYVASKFGDDIDIPECLS